MRFASRLRCYVFALFVALIAGFATQVAFAANELFVADRATNRILSFNPTTGAFNRVLVSTGLNIPTSLAFGPGGDLYVGNLGSGEIRRVNPASGASTSFGFIGGVGGLAYDAGSNTLFASEFGNFDGDEVYQFNSSGTIIKVIGTGSGATGRAGVAIRGGNLYVSQFGVGQQFLGSVLKYDGANNFAPLGVVASDAPDPMNPFDPPLNGANGLAFDAAGKLYVAGLISQSVMKFDISGGPATFGIPFAIPVAYPAAVVVDDESGNEVMYITSLGNDNLNDPIYPNVLFPGAIYKYDVSDNTLIGGAPLVASGGAADFNNDGIVDAADLTKWASSFQTNSGADADSDQDTDGNDFLAWQQNLGRLGDFQPTAVVVYKPGMTTAAPEPASVMLGAAAAAAIAAVRRRRFMPV